MLDKYDVAIIGGGPAGLSAAIVLARSCRRIIIIDSGSPRNLRSHGIHGFITRDGMKPNDMLRIGKDEVLHYGAEFIRDTVTDIIKDNSGFHLILAGTSEIKAKKILLATGIKDNLPPLPGIDKFYGKSIFHCPYCDGWESRGKKIAVYAVGKAAYALSLSLKTWSDKVVIVSDGPHRISKEEKLTLTRSGIEIYTTKISGLIGSEGCLEQIKFADGRILEAEILYFSAPQYQKSALAEKLGCKMSNKGFVLFGRNQSTNIKGLFVAGDAAHDMKFVVVAAAEGAKAAVAINIELRAEEVEALKST